MYREGLLILGIIFIILGVIIPFIPYAPDVIGTVFLILGIIAIVLWGILYLVSTLKSGS
jgi:hypothetical protein